MPAPAKQFDLRDLVAEVQREGTTSLTGPIAYNAPRSLDRYRSQYNLDAQGREVDEYNPFQPILAARSNIDVDQDAHLQFGHNPHPLATIAKARYTRATCKRCNAYGDCSLHRPAPRLDTSVSLCDHRRLILSWAINDPANRKCSWHLEIKNYTRRDGTGAECAATCRIRQPSDRAALLTDRLIEDFEYLDRKVHREYGKHNARYIKPVRLNHRATMDEIRLLMSGWEHNRVIYEQRMAVKKCKQELIERQECKRRADIEKRQKQQIKHLAEIMRRLQKDKEARGAEEQSFPQEQETRERDRNQRQKRGADDHCGNKGEPTSKKTKLVVIHEAGVESQQVVVELTATAESLASKFAAIPSMLKSPISIPGFHEGQAHENEVKHIAATEIP